MKLQPAVQQLTFFGPLCIWLHNLVTNANGEVLLFPVWHIGIHCYWPCVIHRPTLTQFCALLKTVQFCRAYETLLQHLCDSLCWKDCCTSTSVNLWSQSTSWELLLLLHVCVYYCAFYTLPMTCTGPTRQKCHIVVCSSSRQRLIMLRARLCTIGDRSFHVMLARAWNTLPPSVTLAPTLTVFKRQLVPFLFDNSFLWLFILVMYCVLEAVSLMPH